AVKIVVDEIKKLSKKISDSKEDIAQVATNSADDEEMGNIIAEVISEVGKDGVVTVEESQTFGLSKELVSGMRFDKGYVSAYMITDAERMEAVFEKPLILVTDKKISALNEIVPLLEKVAQSGRKDLVIIAEEIEAEALATLIVNKLRGTFHTLAIKAPGFGDRKKEMLEDIAILTGAEFISEDRGLKLENTELNMLGEAEKVVSTKENTTLVGGKGSKSAIEKRIIQIKTAIKNSDSEFDKEKLQERLAKLSAGVAVIRVGAATEVEANQKKQKLEDALASAHASLEEGIVPGGGVALIRASKALEKINLKDEDERVGAEILYRALYSPLRQLAINAGLEAGVVVAKVKDGEGDFGYNFKKMKYEKLLESGVVDPAKVVRFALQNAASATGMLLTTEVAIADEPKNDDGDASQMPAGGMGMGGMM
ncbi:MAG: molecular chaperone GroEL, partial [Candidatus Spechtbacteria bacterium RIFCSPLOWO2_02_FULL_38_8]